MKSAGVLISVLRERASLMASSDRSTPVAMAPRLAHDKVSIPKWHWRCKSVLFVTSPNAFNSGGFREQAPCLNSGTL